jgi:hypothetical protein
MRCGIPIALLFIASLGGFARTDHDVLVIVGAPGEACYAEGFEEAAQAWEKAGQATNAVVDFIGRNLGEDSSPKEQVLDWIQNLDPESAAPVWIVYIGHGTYNRRDAYLNIKGPDISAKELEDWAPTMDRTLIFIHGGSASSPFMTALSGPNRIVISGTRNPDEINYARFGEFFANVLANSDGDIDQDGQTSLLEAFLTTSDRVESFYTEAGRLSSEHALIDDNGDKLGTPPDWFRGVRVTKRSKTGKDADGFRAHQIVLIPSEQEKRLSAEQRNQRDALEAEIEVLRKKKSSFQEKAYYEMLEAILLKLSNLYFPKDADGNLIDLSSQLEGT